MGSKFENGVKGVVKEIRYFGAFSHLIVDLFGSTTVVRVDSNAFRVGDSVKLRIDESAILPHKKNGS